MILWFGMWACSLAGTPLPEGMILVEIKGKELRVEVADEPTERQRGLMYRTELDADAGMVFVYPDELERKFWMENTRLPLSIAYVDKKGAIVHIADMTPFDRTTVPSVKPAMYAIEVNQGIFESLGIAVGDSVVGLPGPSQD